MFGNIAPARTISGPDTLLGVPVGISVNSAGSIYIANDNGGSVTVYGPGANGDAVPTQVISGSKTGIDHPFGLFVR